MSDSGDRTVRASTAPAPAVHRIAARTHGRYLVDAPGVAEPLPLLVGFHGYAERAEHMLDALRRVRGERRWLLVSVEALNRFYTRANDVVANWMTRDDREVAIDDNIAYVAGVIAAVRREHATNGVVVYAGFSQGVAMAYRAAVFAAARDGSIPPASGAIMLAGDVPPELAARVGVLPELLIGRGRQDTWYTEEKAAADLDVLERAGVSTGIHVFEGGHVWEDTFIEAAGRFLDRVAALGGP
jgi:predicted esterase